MDDLSRKALIRELYPKLGGDAEDLNIGPSREDHGVQYRVKMGDKEKAILRKRLDDRNFLSITNKINKTSVKSSFMPKRE